VITEDMAAKLGELHVDARKIASAFCFSLGGGRYSSSPSPACRKRHAAAPASSFSLQPAHDDPRQLLL
jgi:hypothetical protein